MRDYGKVYTAIWRSKKFRGLPSDDCRLLYLYLHTCPHANMLGCFALDEGYALSDLGWTAKRYREGIDTLSKAHLIGFDRSENLVRIVDFIKHDPFSNPKHAIAAVKMAEKLPDCPEKQRLIDDLSQAKHVNPAALKDTLSIPYRYQEPEPEPEPEPKEEEKIEPVGSQKKSRAPETDLPPGWVPNDRNIADAQSRQFSAQEIDHEADRFRNHHAAKGSRFRDWDAAWRTWLGNARKFADRSVAGTAATGGYGQGGSIASIAARRRAAGQV